jgi:hypothetical protein
MKCLDIKMKFELIYSRRLPDISLTREQYEAAMAGYPTRGTIANLAAHGYDILRAENGDFYVLSSWQRVGYSERHTKHGSVHSISGEEWDEIYCEENGSIPTRHSKPFSKEQAVPAFSILDPIHARRIAIDLHNNAESLEYRKEDVRRARERRREMREQLNEVFETLGVADIEQFRDTYGKKID